MTGGAMQLSGPMAHGRLGEIRIQTDAGRVSAVIEFLAKDADCVPSAQAFRFISVESPDRKRLAQALEAMLKRGYGVNSKRSVIVFLQHLAQRLTKAG